MLLQGRTEKRRQQRFGLAERNIDDWGAWRDAFEQGCEPLKRRSHHLVEAGRRKVGRHGGGGYVMWAIAAIPSVQRDKTKSPGERPGLRREQSLGRRRRL